jgi:fatty acid desaturase
MEMNARAELAVTPETTAQISALSRLYPSRSISALLLDWSVIWACFGVTCFFRQPWVWAACAAAVLTRQHALLVLMHDASHFRLLPSKRWNDWVSDLFLAYPFGITTDGFRRGHLGHHRFLGTDRDPEWVLRHGKDDWQFPMRPGKFVSLFARMISGKGVLDIVRNLRMYDQLPSTGPIQRSRAQGVARVVYYLAMAALIWRLHWGRQVLVLWSIPEYIFLPAIMRLRSIADHHGLEGETLLNSARDYHPGWLSRLLFFPHYAHYHLVHHLYPAIPFYHLPLAQQALAKEETMGCGLRGVPLCSPICCRRKRDQTHSPKVPEITHQTIDIRHRNLFQNFRESPFAVKRANNLIDLFSKRCLYEPRTNERMKDLVDTSPRSHAIDQDSVTVQHGNQIHHPEKRHFFLSDQMLSDNQVIQPGRYKAAQGVLNAVDNRFPVVVERGVQENRDARQLPELVDEVPVDLIVGAVDGLDSCASIDVGDCP